jgi:1-deoxy-D-xylulose-5-phosphate reductoisomerase
LNAANEVAVAAFLDEKIKFGDIPRLIRAACEAHTPQPASSLETALAADQWARDWVERKIAMREQRISSSPTPIH